MTVCKLCNGNDYIKHNKLIDENDSIEMLWSTKPCPLCVPITEADLNAMEKPIDQATFNKIFSSITV